MIDTFFNDGEFLITAIPERTLAASMLMLGTGYVGFRRKRRTRYDRVKQILFSVSTWLLLQLAKTGFNNAVDARSPGTDRRRRPASSNSLDMQKAAKDVGTWPSRSPTESE